MIAGPRKRGKEKGGGTALLQMRAHLRLMRHLGSDEENDDDDIYGGEELPPFPAGLERIESPNCPHFS